MKTMMKFGVFAAVGCALLSGCASTSLTPEQEAEVGVWRDDAQMLLEATDPDLTAACQSGIAEVDTVANTVTPVSQAMSKMVCDYIRVKQAQQAWEEYVGWMNSAEPAKLKGDELKAASLRQAKVACFEAGLMLNTKDPEADALKVWDKRHMDVTKDEEVDALLASVQIPELEPWADALVKNYGESPEPFYNAIKVEQGKWADLLPSLAAHLATLTGANTKLADVLKKPELAAKLNPLTGSKETIAAVNRLRKQLTVSIKEINWMVDDIRNGME